MSSDAAALLALERKRRGGGGGGGGALHCARAMLAAEGPAVFWRGWLPLWARFLPSSVLTFYVYEQLRRALVGSYLD